MLVHCRGLEGGSHAAGEVGIEGRPLWRDLWEAFH